MRAPLATEALLLRASDRGEDDRLLSILSPELGRVPVLARHARGSHRRFGAALQPFRRFEAALRPGDGGLFFLDGASVLELPLGPDAGLDVLAAAWLCLDLGHAFSVAGQAQPAFFELLLSGLRRLGLGKEMPVSVRQSVLWGTLAQAGWVPDLERCVSCASTGHWNRMSLDTARGGLLCELCLSPSEASLPEGTAEHWAALAKGLPVGAGPVRAEEALLRWTEHHAGRAFSSAALLGLGTVTP
ncbi:MAG: DNA repair protein RecO [bacterium]